VKLLLKYGANPYIKNKNNETVYEMIDKDSIKNLATVRVLQFEIG
jgi:ankyrin repeat protein